MFSSPSKRRKVAAPTPVSAISALAARRRLAASAPVEDPLPSPPESSSNPFMPLQPKRERLKSVTRAAAGQISSSGDVAHRQGSNTETEPTKAVFSSFSLSECNHRVQDDKLELHLEEGERFLIVGSFGVRVLTGEVTVTGAVLRPSQNIHWIHAPHCHAIPVLRTTETTSLELHQDYEAEGLRQLGRLSPLFRNIWNDLPVEAVQSRQRGPTSFRFLSDSDDAPRGSVIQQLVCPPKWNIKLASIVDSASRRVPVSALICGPKSSGKSTFSRILTNRLLTATDEESIQTVVTGVAVLDLDPGQPEYGPPGTVSLAHIRNPNLGVPFTHPSLDDEAYKVVRCHSLASVNPASTTELHLECALDLYHHYRHTLRNCPLVINTPGWILSLGLEFLVDVVAKVRPVDVIYMSEDGPAETVDALGEAAPRRLTLLPSQPYECKSRTAAQSREMQAMSYFHSVPSTRGLQRLGWSPQALSSVRPLVVPYRGRRRGFLGILRYDYQLPLDLVAEAINGMVLAMVEVDGPEAFRGRSQEYGRGDGAGDATLEPTVVWSPEGLPVIPNADDLGLDPRHSRTIGLALVRGVDTANKWLQMLTPTPLDKINAARSRGCGIVLVHGTLDAPTWSYTEHLYEQVDEDSDSEPDETAEPTEVPWVEVLRGNQRRPVGSRVWRVRRDLGRGARA
ncbi:hypothetical protein L249_0119 [Ophiocordyceps polyrhachis-furcata BCC 54312]|uniref:Polynucleotide 5'-hydroxyl-kinase GRC3 n=1 Tax=Ophiocordyceps polyrhachis-furcata BCC 54312 TaxID=1330021 RepID=A0A367LG91_9HYPO|nr:hypothetical protein L249_0119 [Ophiocordyceps polyrhachis-furcata BCC 54312]